MTSDVRDSRIGFAVRRVRCRCDATWDISTLARSRVVQRKSRKGIKPAKSGHHLRLSVAHCTAALKSGFIYSVTLTAVSPPPLATPRTHPPRAAHFTSRPPVCPSAVSHSYLTRVPTRSAVLASPTARESSSLTDHRRLARRIGGDFPSNARSPKDLSTRPSCPRPRCPHGRAPRP